MQSVVRYAVKVLWLFFDFHFVRSDVRVIEYYARDLRLEHEDQALLTHLLYLCSEQPLCSIPWRFCAEICEPSRYITPSLSTTIDRSSQSVFLKLVETKGEGDMDEIVANGRVAWRWLIRMVQMLLLFSIAVCTSSSVAEMADSKPNIVLLFADDLGYGDLGCYGHPTSKSPNVDVMAREGLRFTQFYSASPVCSPSRAALLTGRYQIRSGIWPMVFGAAAIGGLPHNETTIAEGLKDVGYSTAMVGKWHLGVGENYMYLPTTQGFDHYLGIPYSHDSCPCIICFYPNQSCFDRCAASTAPCPLFEDDKIIQQPVDLTTLTQRYTDAATAFIQKSADVKTPFFLYVAYQHTHHPQFASQKFRNSTGRGTMGDSLFELDDSVGQIFAALKASGADENTFVFFTADNGPSLTREVRGGNQGLLKCGKGTCYEGGQREPAIAWMPGKVPAGKVTHELAATVDVFPTLFKMAGAKVPTDRIIDGVDMSPILFAPEGKTNRTHYFYYPKDPSPKIGLYAIRDAQYKAHFYTQGSHCDQKYRDQDCWDATKQAKQDPPLLFDLLVDPSEGHPIKSHSPEYIAAMASLQKVADEFQATAVFAESQILRGSNQTVLPCCSPGCSPFPSCCTCNKSPFVPGTSPRWWLDNHSLTLWKSDRPSLNIG